MSISTTSRRSVAAAFVAVLFVTAACGNRTEVSEVGTTPVQAPGVPRHQPMSADAAERQGQQLAQQLHPAISADAAERQYAQQETSSSEDSIKLRRSPDPRIPD